WNALQIGWRDGEFGTWLKGPDGTDLIIAGQFANNVVNTPTINQGAVTNHVTANGYSASLISVYGGTMLIIFTAVFKTSSEGSKGTLTVSNTGGALASVSAQGVFAANSARESVYMLRLMVSAAAGDTITATLSYPSDMQWDTPIMTISEFRV
ncbi:hypothetical protein, partial [Nitrospirillum amazonense]|uniref:hypothetical protein n=1 Tax=Nitrospirillum amazonense TaxID=28077 RepID=UPI0024123A59